ncbi:MAG: SUMF1/EgtB/PvdO family nonheme iron enzyme [Verrucomicrobia bacterium]|nr:SUMF1/EgtB/PvdO family nonheme iron enzyme [Verrucomicrobiota bacterium]
MEQPVGTNIADGGTKDFGSSSRVTFTIRNTGTANLTGLTITKDGTNAADFTVTANPVAPVSGPSGTTTFTVAFTPTAVGVRSAAIHIANNDSDENPFDITLTGTGIAPEITVAQPPGTNLADGGSKVFGTAAVGLSTSLTFTVSNTGSDNLSGLALSRNGANAADFTVGALGASTLAPGTSTTFTVTFAPGAVGWRNAAIHLASNDADENPFDIALSGLGYTPDEFASTGSITVPASGLSSPASPYPSTITVSGVMGRVSALRVKLNGLSHTYPDDLDLFLVAPSGQVCALMSDAGDRFSLPNINLTFDDAAASAIPDALAITAGTYRPADYETGEALPPGGAGAIGTNLLALVAGDVNGTWKLFASDDFPSADSGAIASWSLVFDQTFTDDHGDSFATATPLPAAAATSGTPGLLSAGDGDFFRVTVPGPGILIAWSEGAPDTYGYLYGNDRTLLVEDDNNDLQANFRVSAGVVAGDYYIRVKGSRSNTAGTYTLRTRFIPETEPIQVSYLEKAGDDVNLGFTGSAGVLYHIQSSADLQDWELLATMTGTEAENYATLPGQGLQPQRYFRVSTDVPPPLGFSLIPAGAFTMGDSLDGISDAPTRTVTLSAFYMGQKAVTKAEWDVVKAWAVSNGYTDLAVGAGKATNHPVQSVTWYDTVKWCNARSEKEGLTPCYTLSGAVYRTTNNAAVACNWAANGYRLPTEAEREKAARGGVSGKRFPWGDIISHSQANFRNDGGETYQTGTTGYHPTYYTGSMPYTSPVGSFTANGYGLQDMAGNVWECCWDWYGTYASGAQTDPRGAASGLYRVGRGGSWYSYSFDCRVAGRYYYNPANSLSYRGFRVVRSSVP